MVTAQLHLDQSRVPTHGLSVASMLLPLAEAVRHTTCLCHTEARVGERKTEHDQLDPSECSVTSYPTSKHHENKSLETENLILKLADRSRLFVAQRLGSLLHGTDHRRRTADQDLHVLGWWR